MRVAASRLPPHTSIVGCLTELSRCALHGSAYPATPQLTRWAIYMQHMCAIALVRAQYHIESQSPTPNPTYLQLSAPSLQVSPENFTRILSLLYQIFPQLEELVDADSAPKTKDTASAGDADASAKDSNPPAEEAVPESDTTDSKTDVDTPECAAAVKADADTPAGVAKAEAVTEIAAEPKTDSGSAGSSGGVSVCICEKVATDLLVVLAANVQRLRLSNVDPAQVRRLKRQEKGFTEL